MLHKLIASILGLCIISFILGIKVGYDIKKQPTNNEQYICRNSFIEFKNGEICCFKEDCYFKYPINNFGIFEITDMINISGVDSNGRFG